MRYHRWGLGIVAGLLLAGALAGSAVTAEGGATTDADSLPDGWHRHRVGLLELVAPGTLSVSEGREGSGGRLLLLNHEGFSLGLIVLPMTTDHLFDEAFRRGEQKPVAAFLQSAIPILQGSEIRLQTEAPGTEEAVMMGTATPSEGSAMVVRAWRMPSVGSLVFLFAEAGTLPSAEAQAERMAGTVRVVETLKFPIDKPASHIAVRMPEHWALALSDAKKWYWVTESGDAFFLLSRPWPTGGADRLPGYGMRKEMAEEAIQAVEWAAGRKVTDMVSRLVFDKRLWCVVARATATVEYKSGAYTVEMQRWVDPRTGGYQRIYIGGRTSIALNRARKLRESIFYVWQEDVPTTARPPMPAGEEW